jgi:hypothetical protein
MLKMQDKYAWWWMVILILNVIWEWCWLEWRIMKRKKVTCSWSNLKRKWERKIQIKGKFMNNKIIYEK